LFIDSLQQFKLTFPQLKALFSNKLRVIAYSAIINESM
jgi:hypothetical protein